MNGRSLHPDAVLFAAGRSVNTNGLGLEEAGVEMDKLGRIKVDRDYKTTADGIYAAGDVLGPTLASVAIEQGRIAGCRIFGIELTIIVRIKDTGTGIHPEILPRLFSKFVTGSDIGTGLGLFISKNIVEAHGGKISGENNADGKGATFVFSLPSKRNNE